MTKKNTLIFALLLFGSLFVGILFFLGLVGFDVKTTLIEKPISIKRQTS
jgi:hypothetical protein